MLQQLSFKHKIALLIASSVAGLALIAGLSIVQTRSEIIDGKKGALRTAVQAAQNIAVAYQAKAVAGTMSVEDAKKAAREAIRVSRYGGAEGKSDYFYIFTTEGVGVMHPFKPEWEGQDMIGKVKDTSGLDMSADAVAQALDVSADEWRAELPLIEEWFEKIGTALPTSMRDELESLKTRLDRI